MSQSPDPLHSLATTIQHIEEQEQMWNLGLVLLLRRRQCHGFKAAQLTRIIAAWERQIGVKNIREKALDRTTEKLYNIEDAGECVNSD